MGDDRAAVTHRRVLNIALPVVLANVTLPILGAVDTVVVGQMGAAAPIGAVGIGAIILGAFYWLFGFLRMGTVGIASQALGAGQHGEVAALLTRVLLLGGGGGVVFVILQQPLFGLAFQLSPASPEVEDLASQYMTIRILSAPAAIAMFGITGWLVAQERTRAVLVIQLWMNGLNVALDLWFVLGLGWGVEGVAIATFVAEWSGLALAIWLCRHTFITPLWRDWSQVFDRARLNLMWSVNRDILIRSLLLDGFAFAAEALVGQAFGARLRHQVRRAALLAGVWGGISALALALGFSLFGGAVIDIMTTAPEVRLVARDYLPYMVIAPLLAVGPFILDGIFVGATRSRDMRNMMFVSFVIYALAVLCLLPSLDNHGLWMALLVSFVARGLTLGLRYRALEQAALH